MSDVIGYGVVATKLIPRGTITWVLDPLDQILDAERVNRLGPEYGPLLEKYTYVDRRGKRILCWDFARFMNHSCAANSLSPGLTFEIAVRDIHPGEEVTSDYGALNLERPFQCMCGVPDCRGIVQPEDFDRLTDMWDQCIRDAFVYIRSVAQPLLPWVSDERAIDAGVADPRSIPSIAWHRWRGPSGHARMPRLARDAR